MTIKEIVSKYPGIVEELKGVKSEADIKKVLDKKGIKSDDKQVKEIFELANGQLDESVLESVAGGKEDPQKSQLEEANKDLAAKNQTLTTGYNDLKSQIAAKDSQIGELNSKIQDLQTPPTSPDAGEGSKPSRK